MTVEVPGTWKKLWERFDRRFADLGEAASIVGVSCAGISSYMRIGLECPVTQHPAFIVWMSVRHNVTNITGLRDRLTGDDRVISKIVRQKKKGARHV